MLLTIDKKATTEAEAADILARSYVFCARNKPYGVPVLILRPETFNVKGQPDDIGNVQSQYHSRLSRFLRKIGEDQGAGQSLLRESSNGRTIIDTTRTLIAACQDDGYMYASCKAIAASGFAQNADYYAPGAYRAPSFAIIQAPRKDLDGVKRLSYMLDAERVNLAADMPGMAAQWQFLDLWHEVGHAAGAGEAQTEKMAAALCRKAFNDVSFLQVEADIRYTKAVLFSDDREVRERYGWGMGQAVDEICALSAAEIDALSDEDIRDMRFERYDARGNITRKLGAALREDVGADKMNGNYLPEIAVAAKKLLSGAFKNAAQDEKDVIMRFHLAVSRLAQGKRGYQPN